MRQRMHAALIGVLVALCSFGARAATVTPGSDVTSEDYGPSGVDSDYKLKQSQGREVHTTYPSGTTSEARGGDSVVTIPTDYGTATPSPTVIPVTGGDGKLDPGFIPDLSGTYSKPSSLGHIDPTQAPWYASGSPVETTTTGTNASGATTVTVASCTSFKQHHGLRIDGSTPYVGTVTGCTSGNLGVTPATSASYSSGTRVRHDDTAAIQGAIDQLGTNGGGQIDFPPGYYDCNPTTLRDPTNAKAVLQLPSVLYDIPPPSSVSITLNGTVPPSHISLMHGKDTGGGAVIHTDNRTTGGSLLGAYPTTCGIYGCFTNVGLSIIDMTFRTYDDPVISGINAGRVGSLFIDHVNIDTGGGQTPTHDQITYPQTTSLSFGLITSGSSDSLPQTVRNLSVQGFSNGVLLQEHAQLWDYYSSLNCNAINAQNGYEGGAFKVVVDVACAGLTGSGTVQVVDITCDQCAFLINDGANNLHGSMTYKLGSGAHQINGGSNMYLHNLSTGEIHNNGILAVSDPAKMAPFDIGTTTSATRPVLSLRSPALNVAGNFTGIQFGDSAWQTDFQKGLFGFKALGDAWHRGCFSWALRAGADTGNATLADEQLVLCDDHLTNVSGAFYNGGGSLINGHASADLSHYSLTSNFLTKYDGSDAANSSLQDDGAGHVGVGSAGSGAPFDIYSTVTGGAVQSLRANLHVANNWAGLRFGDYTQVSNLYQKGGLLVQAIDSNARLNACLALNTATDATSATWSDCKLTLSNAGDLTVAGTLTASNLAGTTNYLPKKTATGWADSSVVDDGAGNVGISAGATPGASLDIGNIGGTSNIARTLRLSGRSNVNGTLASILLSNSTDTGGKYAGIVARRDSDNNGVSLDFNVNNSFANGGAALTALTLRYNGLVYLPNGSLSLAGTSSGNSVLFNVGASTAGYTLTFPTTSPGAGQTIVYPSGGGQGTWVTPLAGILTTTRIPVATSTSTSTATSTSTLLADGYLEQFTNDGSLVGDVGTFVQPHTDNLVELGQGSGGFTPHRFLKAHFSSFVEASNIDSGGNTTGHAASDLTASTAIGASGGDYAWAYRTGTNTTTDTATGTSTSCPLNRNCTMVRTSTTTATATITNTINGHAISGNPVLDYSDVGAPPASRTVCGHALSSDVACTASDVGAVATSAYRVKQIYTADISSDYSVNSGAGFTTVVSTTINTSTGGDLAIAGTISGFGSASGNDCIVAVTIGGGSAGVSGAYGRARVPAANGPISISVNASALGLTGTQTIALTMASASSGTCNVNAGTGTYQSASLIVYQSGSN